MRSLLTFVFCLCVGAVFAQLQVVAPNGFVGINTSAPTQRLEIQDSPSNTPGFLVNAGGQNFVKAAAGASGSAFLYKDAAGFYISPAANSSSVVLGAGSFAVIGANAATYIGPSNAISTTEQLVVGGNVRAANFIQASDRRLKNNIRPYATGLEAVLKINPVRYTYNGKGGTIAGTNQIGLIAQNLQEVAPEMVKEFEHAEYGLTSLAEPMAESRNKETFLAVKDNQIKFMLINAIKEQQEIISSLEARIANLESGKVKVEKTPITTKKQ